ncbi:MAG: cytochrome c biogenesis protein ResB [Prosthecobacter sp.]|uniref:cytochrome c biogenesis protein ResB n=1 Tax=Prosthecobacter sp. TaxID=1965333 RepID=UPI0025FBA6CD|nr:cytochrome c biogenesis protein ResB [Prosthecobacter sp.]MCF7784953.1 cytochrome c biogenesis protein ResB [Prosthecobacter sp.]
MSAPSKSLPAKIFAFFSSFGLATSVLVMLLVLTFLGTLEQAEHGLVASQARYFESAFIDRIDIGACWRALGFHAYRDIGNVSLPLYIVPGGYTLMALLFVNLLCGGIVRIRKSPKTIGVIISHFAILFMIAAGAVTHHYAIEGNLNLSEGQTNDEFLSFHDRVIEIEKLQKDPKAKRSVLVIDESKFRDVTAAGNGRTFTSDSLPFDLIIAGWKKNAQPKRDKDGSRTDAVDGYFIQELPQLDEAGAALADEQLASACVAIAKIKNSDEKQTGILWEFAAAPWTVTVGADKYLISLVHRTYKLPFAVRLDETKEEKHPGTERARLFSSKVTKITGDHEEKRFITMNEPVRSEGYAVFQSTFSSGEKEGTGVKSSGFMIVENPADHWPLISCIIVAEGLLLHFLMMLARFIKVNPWKFALGLIAAFNAAFALAMWKLL